MADTDARSPLPPEPPDDDRLDAGDRHDPIQIAMDGLLSEHFDPSGDDEEFIAHVHARIAGSLREREALARADVPETPAGKPVSSRWGYGLGGLAALGLAAGFLLLLTHTSAPADANLLRDVVQQGDVLFSFSGNARLTFLGSDRDALDALERKVQAWRLKRDHLREAYLASPQSSTHAICQIWQLYVVGLRELGLREESVAETQAAIEFSRQHPSGCWPHIYLDCLGLTHAAFGDLTAARTAFRESIEVRSLLAGAESDPHRHDPDYKGHLASNLLIPYLRMMMLSLAEGRMSEARRWHDNAETMLQQRWTTICESAGVRLRPGVSALDAYMAAPPVFQQPPGDNEAALQRSLAARYTVYPPSRSDVTLLRIQLLHTAIIRRHEGDLRAAKVALQRAGDLPDFPDSDEFGLPMLEAIEAARVALLEGRTEDAIAATEVAEAYKRQLTPDEPPVNLLITSPLRKAEIRMLRGLALLQRDPHSLAGRAAIEHAARLVEALSLRVPPEKREAFLARFQALKRLADGDRNPSRSPSSANAETPIAESAAVAGVTVQLFMESRLTLCGFDDDTHRPDFTSGRVGVHAVGRWPSPAARVGYRGRNAATALPGAIGRFGRTGVATIPASPKSQPEGRSALASVRAASEKGTAFANGIGPSGGRGSGRLTMAPHRWLVADGRDP